MDRIPLEALLEALGRMQTNDSVLVEADAAPASGEKSAKKAYTIVRKEFKQAPLFIVAHPGGYEVFESRVEVDGFIKHDLGRGALKARKDKKEGDASSLIREAYVSGGTTLQDRVIDYLLTTHVRSFENLGQEVLVSHTAVKGMRGVHSDTTPQMVSEAIESLMEEEILIVGSREISGYVVKWHPVFVMRVNAIREEKARKKEKR